jgi:hypothetical protein
MALVAAARTCSRGGYGRGYRRASPIPSSWRPKMRGRPRQAVMQGLCCCGYVPRKSLLLVCSSVRSQDLWKLALVDDGEGGHMLGLVDTGAFFRLVPLGCILDTFDSVYER